MNTHETTLFIGFFSIANKPHAIAGFIARHCPEAEKVWVIRKLIYFNSKVYCCRVQFRTRQAADRAAKALKRPQTSGKTLTVRPWRGRTGANERRDIHWRTEEWPGRERRMIERRDHHPLVYRYDSFLSGHPVPARKSAPAAERLPGVPSALGAIGLSVIPEERLEKRFSDYFAAFSLGSRA